MGGLEGGHRQHGVILGVADSPFPPLGPAPGGGDALSRAHWEVHSKVAVQPVVDILELTSNQIETGVQGRALRLPEPPFARADELLAAAQGLSGLVMASAIQVPAREAEIYRGILEARQLRLLEGEEGELVPGVTWVRTPGHSHGSVCYRVETAEGLVVLAGDTIGPLQAYFDEMRLPDGWEDGEELLAAWALIRSWRPARVIAGHLPPFSF